MLVLGQGRMYQRRGVSVQVGGERDFCIHRPAPPPVFNRLQYAKMEGDNLVNLTM